MVPSEVAVRSSYFTQIAIHCYTAIAPPCARNLSMRRPTTKHQGSRGVLARPHPVCISTFWLVRHCQKYIHAHNMLAWIRWGTDPWLHKNKRDRLLDLFGIMLRPWIDGRKQSTRNQLIVDDDCWWRLLMTIVDDLYHSAFTPLLTHGRSIPLFIMSLQKTIHVQKQGALTIVSRLTPSISIFLKSSTLW